MENADIDIDVDDLFTTTTQQRVYLPDPTPTSTPTTTTTTGGGSNVTIPSCMNVLSRGPDVPVLHGSFVTNAYSDLYDDQLLGREGRLLAAHQSDHINHQFISTTTTTSSSSSSAPTVTVPAPALSGDTAIPSAAATPTSIQVATPTRD